MPVKVVRTYLYGGGVREQLLKGEKPRGKVTSHPLFIKKVKNPWKELKDEKRSRVSLKRTSKVREGRNRCIVSQQRMKGKEGNRG